MILKIFSDKNDGDIQGVTIHNYKIGNSFKISIQNFS